MSIKKSNRGSTFNAHTQPHTTIHPERVANYVVIMKTPRMVGLKSKISVS